MIKLYAPADTEDVPILSKKVRKQKQILSYIFLILGLIIAAVINNSVISNIITVLSMTLDINLQAPYTLSKILSVLIAFSYTF